MRQLPGIDLHAHIEVEIEEFELLALEAVVFAVTRSLDEAAIAIQRKDRSVVWGVGCHPGLVSSQKSFDVDRFKVLLTSTPFAGELGLDGGSRVPMTRQRQNLELALMALAESPRITSLHSYKATAELLKVIEQNPQTGLILHWWLGSVVETRKAVDLGCYFSVNRSSLRRTDVLNEIPLNRLLPETDHPYGDKGRKDRRPGRVDDVEAVLAKRHGLTPQELRRVVWSNLSNLVSETGVSRLLPRGVRRILASA